MRLHTVRIGSRVRLVSNRNFLHPAILAHARRVKFRVMKLTTAPPAEIGFIGVKGSGEAGEGFHFENSCLANWQMASSHVAALTSTDTLTMCHGVGPP